MHKNQPAHSTQSGKADLVIVSAPSGGGKTTLCHLLLKDFPKLVLSVSTTTRKPRGQEMNGKEYFFVDRSEFENKIKAGDFAEWAEVHGNLYGTSKATLDRAIESGKAVLLDIDVKGAMSLKRAYPGRTVTIFVTPPSLAELEKRLRARKTDSEETILRRIKHAEAEMKAAKDFDHVIVNHVLEDCYQELNSIVGGSLHE